MIFSESTQGGVTAQARKGRSISSRLRRRQRRACFLPPSGDWGRRQEGSAPLSPHGARRALGASVHLNAGSAPASTMVGVCRLSGGATSCGSEEGVPNDGSQS